MKEGTNMLLSKKFRPDSTRKIIAYVLSMALLLATAGHFGAEQAHADKPAGGEFMHDITQAPDGGYIAVGQIEHEFLIKKYNKYGELVWDIDYIGGYSYGTLNSVICAGDSFVVAGTNATIAKIDKNGHKIWINRLSGNIDYESVTKSADGGYVAVGETRTPGNINIIADSYATSTALDGNDFVIAKFGADGKNLWTKYYGGGGDDLFHHVVNSADGGYVAVGQTQPDNAADSSDSIIAKFDKDGNEVWFKKYGASVYDLYKALAPAADGGYVAVGEVRLDGGIGSVIVKFNANGEMQWRKPIGTNSHCRMEAIAATGNGYMAIGELYNSGFYFFAAGFDLNGKEQWTQSYGGEPHQHFGAITKASDGNYAVIGEANSEDDGITGDSSHYDYHSIFARINSRGKLVLDGSNKANAKPRDRAYTGKAVKSAPTIVVFGRTLKKGKDYSIIYKNNKNIGTAKVTIKGKGKYSGTANFTFKINPRRISLKQAAAGKRQVKITWGKAAAKQRTSGYQIRHRAKGKTKWSYRKAPANITAVTITKLAKGKRYQVQARAYKKVKGKTYYGQWSGAKTSKRVW
jgi:hypothetical protein